MKQGDGTMVMGVSASYVVADGKSRLTFVHRTLPSRQPGFLMVWKNDVRSAVPFGAALRRMWRVTKHCHWLRFLGLAFGRDGDLEWEMCGSPVSRNALQFRESPGFLDQSISPSANITASLATTPPAPGRWWRSVDVDGWHNSRGGPDSKSTVDALLG